MNISEHSIDVTFHRLYLVRLYKVIDDEEPVHVNQVKAGSIYYTFDERVPQDQRYLLTNYEEASRVGDLGATLIPDFDIQHKDDLKKLLLKKLRDSYTISGVAHLQIALISAEQTDLITEKTYRLHSEQMSKSFAYALGSSGLAKKYGGGRSIGDTRPIHQADIPDEFAEKPRKFAVVLRLD